MGSTDGLLSLRASRAAAGWRARGGVVVVRPLELARRGGGYFPDAELLVECGLVVEPLRRRAANNLDLLSASEACVSESSEGGGILLLLSSEDRLLR